MVVKEADLQRKIQAAIRERGGKVIKTHGGPYSVAGTPDLIGSLNGRPFAIEVKVTGQQPNAKQEAELAAWAAQGWATGVAYSVDDAINITRTEC
jgi:Holliday junction resolvase